MIMTQEEKAKAYDDAFKRASNLYKDAVEMENNMTTKTCEIIFPELSESEDERIRLKLIEAVKGDMVVGGTKDKQLAVAWLEKQGEKPTDEEMKETLRTEYEKGRADVIAEMQKPAWSQEDERIYQSILDDTVQENQLDDKQLDWLKSLKNRHTWKPSDEQMNALSNALSLAKNCGEESAFDLRTLYEQLKKLS